MENACKLAYQRVNFRPVHTLQRTKTHPGEAKRFAQAAKPDADIFDSKGPASKEISGKTVFC